MSTKSKNKKTSSTRPSSSKASNTKPINKKKAPVKKVHGTLLTIALVIMGVHGIVAALMYNSMSTVPEVQRPWIIGMMVVHSLANIAAAFGIFYWKKWGLYVYAYSTIIALVVGLLSVGIWSVFYMVLPFVIVGWLLRTKWDYFE
jgi:lipoprotein signal peptidase